MILIIFVILWNINNFFPLRYLISDAFYASNIYPMGNQHKYIYIFFVENLVLCNFYMHFLKEMRKFSSIIHK